MMSGETTKSGSEIQEIKPFIIFAYDDGQLASADFVMTLGHKASRKDAGSTRRKTTRGIPALLILETIREICIVAPAQSDCGFSTNSVAEMNRRLKKRRSWEWKR